MAKSSKEPTETIVFIASDHAGFKLKGQIKKFLDKENKYNITDLGPNTYEKSDDYPIYAKKLTNKVKTNKNSFGILICGSGIGMCIAANKAKGIRAANINNIKDAKSSRIHNACNILCLSESNLTLDNAKKIATVFLTTDSSTEERHVRRVKQIE